MTDFTIHTEETVADDAKETLAKVKAFYGFVPNLLGGLIEAPVAAQAYMDLTKAVKDSSFTPSERHVVWFTLNNFHNCHYCMAAHTAIAHGDKIPQEEIDTARAGGSYTDPKLEALRVFTLQIAEQRGWVDDKAVEAFLAAGFTKRNVFEVITVTAHKVMSNYANHLLETPLDPPFQQFEWSKQEDAA